MSKYDENATENRWRWCLLQIRCAGCLPNRLPVGIVEGGNQLPVIDVCVCFRVREGVLGHLVAAQNDVTILPGNNRYDLDILGELIALFPGQNRIVHVNSVIQIKAAGLFCLWNLSCRNRVRKRQFKADMC